MEATCEKQIATLVLFVRCSHFRPIAELICGSQRIGGRGVTEWKEERVEGETEGWKVKPWSEKGRQLVMPCLCVCVTKLGSGLDCFVWRDAAVEGRAHENDSVKVPLNTFFFVFCTIRIRNPRNFPFLNGTPLQKHIVDPKI